MDAEELVKRFTAERREAHAANRGPAKVAARAPARDQASETPGGDGAGQIPAAAEMTQPPALRRSARLAETTAVKGAAETPAYGDGNEEAVAEAYRLRGQLKQLKRGKKGKARRHVWQGVARMMLASVSALIVKPGHVPPPTNEKELLTHPYRDYYIAAAKWEKDALKQRGTLLRLVPETEVVKMGKKAAKSRMIYSWKSDVFYPGGDRGPAGERAKARWIICGYSLIYGLDYDKTASPSADMVTWRMMLSLQVQIRKEERLSAQLDVPTAYLWTTDRKLVADPRGDSICSQVPRLWNLRGSCSSGSCSAR